MAGVAEPKDAAAGDVLSPEGVDAWRSAYWNRLMGSLIVMGAGLPFVDRALTAWLAANPWPGFADVMGRSVFNGQAPGASDVATLWQATAVIAYAVREARRRGGPADAAGVLLGYVAFCALFVGIILVQALKFVTGRARPSLVLDEGDTMPFTHWFRVGPHFFGNDHAFNGSFPSGHMASMALLAALVPAIHFCGARWGASRRRRAEGALWLAALASAALMAVARAMSRHHWVTDTLLAFPLVVLTADALFFRLLDVPAQWARLGRQGRRPAFWEARMLGACLVVALGLMLTLGGARALVRWEALWLAAAAPMGAALAVWGWRCLARLRRCVLGAEGLSDSPQP